MRHYMKLAFYLCKGYKNLYLQMKYEAEANARFKHLLNHPSNKASKELVFSKFEECARLSDAWEMKAEKLIEKSPSIPVLEMLKDDAFLKMTGADANPRLLSLRDVFIHRFSVHSHWKKKTATCGSLSHAVCCHLVTKIVDENGGINSESIVRQYYKKNVAWVDVLQDAHRCLDSSINLSNHLKEIYAKEIRSLFNH